jgi:hypothetical protein
MLNLNFHAYGTHLSPRDKKPLRLLFRAACGGFHRTPVSGRSRHRKLTFGMTLRLCLLSIQWAAHA